jgi:DNA-binding NarL/FixJ family response regulator
MTTILLADDHQVMREGLRALLEAEPDFQVIGEAGDGLETVRLVESLHPDVLVVDMIMPGMNGVEVTKRLRQSSPATAVVVLSMYGVESYVHKAMRAGAKAYVLKEASASELVHAIREAVAGRRYLSRTLSEQAIDTYVKETLSTALDPLLALTTREREVLQMVAKGDTSKQIAASLGVSPRTIEFHRASIMRKLKLRNQQELLRYCLRAGILAADNPL